MTIIRKVCFAAICVLLLKGRVSFDDPGTQLDRVFSQLAAQNLFSGVVLVNRGQTTLLRAAYGLADREWNIPNTPLTKFRIASITKGFTAAAIMLLQEQGKLNVQARVCQYIKNCPDSWQPITLHQLLTHTSGIPDYDSMHGYDLFKRQPASLGQIVDFFRNQLLDFTPGARWNYSNSGYILLAQVIEAVSGKSYAAFLQDQFLTPFGLTNTGIEDMTSIVPMHARDYASPTKLAAYLDMTTESAAGQLYSTADDLYNWNQALVSGKVVKAQSFDAMLKAAVPLPESRPPFLNRYGYGIGIGEYQGRDLYFQSGDVSGFISLMFYFPADQTTVIILSNLASIDLQQITAAPLTILYGS